MKRISKHLSFFICFILMLLLTALPAQAASVTKHNAIKKTTSFKADMTHDGKVDTIKVKLTKNGTYISKVTIEINGKKAFSESGLWCYNVNVHYFKYSNKDEFLYVLGRGDSNMPYIQKILYYNTSSKKLKTALDLFNYSAAAGSISIPEKNSLKVGYDCGPGIVGRIHWNFTFKYDSKKHTFKIKKNTASVKNAFTYDPKDGLTSAFKNNKYKTAKTVSFYSDKACTKPSFSVDRGKWVVMKDIYVTKDGFMSVSFKYGSKTGWIKVRDPRGAYVGYGYFEGINNRLAGGFYG